MVFLNIVAPRKVSEHQEFFVRDNLQQNKKILDGHLQNFLFRISRNFPVPQYSTKIPLLNEKRTCFENNCYPNCPQSLIHKVYQNVLMQRLIGLQAMASYIEFY